MVWEGREGGWYGEGREGGWYGKGGKGGREGGSVVREGRVVV